jgi:hypothetical protein
MGRIILFLRSTERRKGLADMLMSSLVALMLVGASACQMQSMSGNGGGVPPPAVSASISFCDDGVASCPPASSFSVGSMHDLVVKIKWGNVSAGNHTETLEFLIPGGAAYRVTQDGFLIPGSSAGPFSAQRTFPVLGTPISQRQMTGNWSVRASLDGQPIATQTVELTP